ncbi:hypothetical protein BJ741DRAFT_648972 [Chytriomyces cf. hyalinus JEL632]|nr:hypothetical protein BJ741DRAFT_648972 [Chytriomyces cf. hyalinus JEL632]
MLVLLPTILLLLSTANSIYAQATTDACASLAARASPDGKLVASIERVEACYNSFPATTADKKAQIDALKGYFNIYPFKYIAKDIKAPYYPMSYDFYADLDSIVADPAITTEYQLQRSIQRSIAKLEDGHNSYTLSCFDAFRFVQPFRLMPAYSGESVSITIDRLYVESKSLTDIWTNGTQQQPLSSYIGATVVSMDGRDPLEYLQGFADVYNPIGHAPETRFNGLFSSYKGLNSSDDSHFADQSNAPRTSTITYELRLKSGSTATVAFPWIGVLNKPITDIATAQTYHASCRAPNKTPTSSLFGPVGAGEAPGIKKVHEDDLNYFYLLADGITGVFHMTGFDPTTGVPEADQPAVIKAWVESMVSGLQGLEAAGATRLIIDLTGNGGGIVIYGWGLLNYIFASTKLEPLEYTFPLTEQLRSTLSNPALVNTEPVQSLLAARTLQGAKLSNAVTELLTPGTTVFNVPVKFTNRFLMDFERAPEDATTSARFSDYAPLKNVYNGRNVVIVSNGFCGSTCAQFTTIARDQLGVKAVTYGGGKQRSLSGTRNFDPTSFAAGFIATYNQIDSYINGISKRDDASDSKLNPAPFLYNVEMAGSTMAFAVSFSTKGKYPDAPIEWVIAASDVHLDSADVKLNDGASVWNAILKSKAFELASTVAVVPGGGASTAIATRKSGTSFVTAGAFILGSALLVLF